MIESKKIAFQKLNLSRPFLYAGINNLTFFIQKGKDRNFQIRLKYTDPV